MYSILFATAARELRSVGAEAHPGDIAAALRAGVDAMMRYGGAARGDRTMLDALIPAIEAFRDVSRAREKRER